MRKYEFSKKDCAKDQQAGNIMFVVVVILLILILLTIMCMHSVRQQMHLVTLRRGTSNTYYLAKSAVEKQIACINTDLDCNLEKIIQDISKEYIGKLAIFESKAEKLAAMKGSKLCTRYDQFVYEGNQLRVVNDELIRRLQDEIYDFIIKNYFENQYLTYEVASDEDTNQYKTVITVKVVPIKQNIKGRETINRTEFKVIATAMTQNIKDNTLYDTQSVEAKVKIDIPENLTNEIHENYTWAARPPEIVASGLISFSDVVVTNGGSLEVENGDLQVKGSGNKYESEIFRNGESLGAQVTQSGGVIVSNGGKLKVQNGDLISIYNVIATNGWSDEEGAYDLATSIEVLRGDIIAHTVGVVDDYYKGGNNQIPFEPMKQGQNLSIHVGQNVFVENDVLISKWTRNSQITIGGTIFGISDGSESKDEKRYSFNPNTSSGVFAQGEGTQILADRILVNGQPYIGVENAVLPMKLWESAGVPFSEIDLWEGYEIGEEQESNKAYLEEDSPYYDFIDKNKIQLYSTDIVNTSYAPGKISANGIISSARAITEKTAKKLFMKGFDEEDLEGDHVNSICQFKNYTHRGDYEGVNYILAQTRKEAGYYRSIGDDYNWYEKALMYGKCYHGTGEALKSNYLGLRGYMTAKRSVFYGKMDEKDVPQLLSFDEVVERLPVQRNKKWSYSNPIIVMGEEDEVIDISKLYREADRSKGGCPSLIINSGNGTLILTATKESQNVFNGVIISKGNVRIKGNIQINGSLIIKGRDEGLNPEKRESRMCGKDETNYSAGLVVDRGAHLKIHYDGDMLLKVHLIDHVVYRQILDALKITQYHSKTDLKEILGPFHDEKLNYLVGKVFYKEDSTLDIALENVGVKIENLKKIRD